MGVHPTSPGFETFTVRSKLGSLRTASITIPTLRGYIAVNASAGVVEVNVPCNTRATLCLPRSSLDAGGLYTLSTTQLLLDGVQVSGVTSGTHLCVAEPVGCGASGAARRLTAAVRAN
jgi:hypothetical protein